MKTLDKYELQEAEEVLKKHLPKSYKVYGCLYGINRGKPTTLEVVVDKWPDFKVIICKPDLTNKHVTSYTLTIFSTDQQILKEMLVQEGTLDWSHDFVFGGLDVSSLPIIKEVCAMNGVTLKDFTNISCHLLHLPDSSLLKPVTVDREFESRITSLDLSHIDLVNNTWKYGGNERGYRFIQNLVSNFPSCCIKDERGQPVSWILTYDYFAIGMLYTLPEHRGKGYAKVLVSAFAKRLHTEGCPVYCYIEEDNTVSYKLFKSLGFIEDPSYRAAWYEVNL